jgi:hypothetical protein
VDRADVVTELMGSDTPPRRPRHRHVPPPARAVLAVLLLAMAAGQVSDFGGFTRILGAYRLFPAGSLTAVAAILAGPEAIAGALLLTGRRAGGALALTVSLLWAALGVEAFVRGLVLHNCGCFGVHLGQPLRWWVLAEDADFVALAAWVRTGLSSPVSPRLGALSRQRTDRARVSSR